MQHQELFDSPKNCIHMETIVPITQSSLQRPIEEALFLRM